MKENSDKAVNKNKYSGYMLILFWFIFPVSIFYMEIVVELHAFKALLGWGTLYIFLLSTVFGLAIDLIVWISGEKVGKILSIVFMTAITVIMGIQAVYYTIFKTFTTIASVTRAGDVITEFWQEMFEGIWNSKFSLIFLFVPLVLLIIFRKKIKIPSRKKWRLAVSLLFIAAALQSGTIAAIINNDTGVMSYEYAYTKAKATEVTVPRFGVLTTVRMEFRDMLLPEKEEEKVISDSENQSEINKIDEEIEKTDIKAPETPEAVIEPEPVVYAPNVMEIDFDKLIAGEADETIKNMHEYFSTRTPTMQNEYTGMFKGYNLVWIVGESFSTYALDETHTPTLYKLSKEGFVFNNFYNPIWGVSTSDGEYTTLLGLIPKGGVWSFSRSSDNYLPFAFGNQMSKLGYKTMAYHDHTYTYYDRELSHPNMGYDYIGVGNGLEITDQWPESDIEMMEKTVGDYVYSEPFHTYYLTVSGHMNYNFIGNQMSYIHMDDVADLPYSEAARAYIACQMETDQAVKYLIDSLDEAGVLDNTVIVMSGDHYPYGLTVEEMEELRGGDVDEDFDMYKSTLIIWNPKMETVQVDKYCSSLDIMPTLANLFGIEYDSRLLSGSDIFSDADSLVMFNNRSFITEYGRYDSITDEFIPADGVKVSEDYASEVLDVVSDKFYYAEKILDYDYYRIVLGDGENG